MFSIIFSTLFINNIILNKIIGACPFIGVSTKRKNALSMGIAVIFVVLMSSIISWALYNYVLVPYDLSFLTTIIFILVIASLVQFVEMVIKKFFPSLYEAFGVYLPLITTNCVVLGVCLNVVNYDYNLLQALVYSASITAGYMLVLVIFSSIRSQLERVNVPKAFKGIPIALMVAACMAMAFSAFNGII